MEMQSKKLAKAKAGPSTQQYIDIAEIREDTVIMKDGTMRVVLAVASINFALKSEEEQGATISAYMQFLNSLEFPLQIVIQSRKLNIDDYLIRLEKSQKEQTNELLKAQIADYRAFIKELVELGEIMNKRFFVVVPYNPLSDKRKNFWARLFELFQPVTVVKLKEERFRRHKGDLMQRVNHVMTNLSSIGLKSIPLDTQSLIELYYRVYNPDLAETEKLADVAKIGTEDSVSV